MKIIDITVRPIETISLGEGMTYLCMSSQKILRKSIPPAQRCLLLPNFVQYSRLLASGKYLACLQAFCDNMHLGKNAALHIKNFPSLIPISGMFWSALVEMCLVDLSSLENKEHVLLNPFLVDAAFHAKKTGVIKNILRFVRKETTGKMGIWTRNPNVILAQSGFDELDFDFLVTPINTSGIGMRVDESILTLAARDANVELVNDYGTHFGALGISIPKNGNYLAKES